jgi:Zn-dependent membrane protease YugP
MYYFDPYLLLWVAPAIILAMVAQWWISAAYSRGQQFAARMNGYQAALAILRANGISDVSVEVTPGHLSDHYSPTEKILRLSPEVYHGNTLSSVGIAAHEVGHALQDAHGYFLMTLRNLAVPAANFGSSFGMILVFLGAAFLGKLVMLAGIALFSGVVLFQLLNLPVEFDASARAKRQLVELGIVDPAEMGPVRNVLYAAALTYVAATLQSVLTLLYYLSFFMGGRSRDE